MPIRGFIDDFNDRRATLVRPGEFLVVDECMSFWEGLDNIHNDFGLPHSSKQLRKPRSQGCELKSCADAQTGIMMRLEILEVFFLKTFLRRLFKFWQAQSHV